jgi:hypothetical protein
MGLMNHQMQALPSMTGRLILSVGRTRSCLSLPVAGAGFVFAATALRTVSVMFEIVR